MPGLSQAYSAAGKYLIENFVIHGLVGAVALPMTVLNVSGLIDSTWAVVSVNPRSAAHWRLRLKCGVRTMETDALQ